MSTTYRMPGTVSEVSATLVERTTRRPFEPEKMLLILHRQPENNGRISVPGFKRRRRMSCVSRISRSPGRNTSTSPGPCVQSSSTASAMASLELLLVVVFALGRAVEDIDG